MPSLNKSLVALFHVKFVLFLHRGVHERNRSGKPPGRRFAAKAGFTGSLLQACGAVQITLVQT